MSIPSPSTSSTSAMRTPLPRKTTKHDMPGSWSIYEQDRIEDAFRAAGHGGPRLLVESAMASGLQPADCDAVVEQMHASVDAKERKPLGPGALEWRIKQGCWPCNLIAKVDLTNEKPVESLDEVDKRRRAKQAAENQRLRDERIAAEQRLRDREATTGKILDSLPEKQLLVLIQKLPEYMRTGFAAQWIMPRPITSCIVRNELFCLLESDPQKSES